MSKQSSPTPESGHHLRRVTPADPMVAALIPAPRSRCTSSRPRPRYKPTTRKRVGRRWPTRSDLAKPSASFLSWLRGKHPAPRRAGGSSGERAPAAGPRCAGAPTLWLRRQILWPRWRGCGGPSTSQQPPRNWASCCTISALVRAGARAPAIAGRWWCWHARVLRLRPRVCGARGGPVGRRAGSRGASGQDGPGWVAVGCCGDGYTHLVSEELIGRDLARSGRVIARCGHVVTAASLMEALRPPCALCRVCGED